MTHLAEPFEVLKAHPTLAEFDAIGSEVLIRAHDVEVLRLVIGAGHALLTHEPATGLLTVHCLEGRVDMTSAEVHRQLEADDQLYFPATAVHSLRARADSILLVTILRCPVDVTTRPTGAAGTNHP